MFMLKDLLGFYCQNTDCQLNLSGNMLQLLMLDKENIIFIKDKRNTLGLELILVQGKDLTKVSNWLTLSKVMVTTVESPVGQMTELILQMKLKNTLLTTLDYTIWLGMLLNG